MSTKMFCYRKDGALQKIDLNNIFLLESANNYVKFYEVNEIHMIRATLELVMEQLPKDLFIQTNRSFAVAFEQIYAVGRNFVILEPLPNKWVPLSEKYFQHVMDRIKILGPASSDQLTSLKK